MELFRKRNVDMTNGPMFGNIVFFAIPLVLSGLLQLLYNAMDLVVVGRFAQSGQDAVSAVGATGAMTGLIINTFLGMSVGVNVTVANALGAKKYDEVSKSVHTAAALGITAGTALGIIGIFIAEPLLNLMSTPKSVISLATLYVKIFFIGTPANLIYNFFAAVLRAKGDTKRPLFILTISGIINVVLNLVFVIVFKLDVAGVAIATVISQYVSAILVSLVLIKSMDCCMLRLCDIKFHAKSLKKIIKIGLPSGISSALFAVSNSLIQTALNSFDSSPILAGSTAAGNIEQFVNVGMDSLAQACITFVGQNKGAKKYNRINKAVGICLGISIFIGIVVGYLALKFAKTLLSIYLPGEDSAIIYGTIRLKYMCPIYFSLGMMNIMSGALRGMGSVIAPMCCSMLGACGLRVLWIYTVFQKIHTLDSLFLLYPVSWCATTLALIVSFVIIRNKLQKKDMATAN